VMFAVGLVPPAPPRSPRPNPDRLPRNCGAISDAEFSAAVVPVSRTVEESAPEVTAAVRIDATAAGACEPVSVEARQYMAAPTKTTAPNSQSHQRRGRDG
jgi:hypothetical protein